MDFLQKMREIKDKVLNNEEQSHATLSAISNTKMFSSEVRESFSKIRNNECYVVTSAQGLTRNQKVENITGEVLTKFFGNTLEGKNPVVSEELSGFISKYLDYNGKMTKEGLFPFGIEIDRKSGYLVLAGEKSTVYVESVENGILAVHSTHALDKVDRKEGINDLVTETKDGQKHQGAVLQIEGGDNGAVFLNKSTINSNVVEAEDNSSGVVSLFANSEAYYVKGDGQTCEISKVKGSVAFKYVNFGNGYKEETGGEASEVLDSLVNGVNVFYDQESIPPMPIGNAQEGELEQ